MEALPNSSIREKHMRFNFVPTVLALSVFCMTAAAQAPGTRTIGSPTTIDQPGNYMLTNALFVNSGAGITITASDVTLDLNGQTISGPANLTGVGIRVLGAQNVVVRNGNVQGVFMGVVVVNSSNVKIDSLMIRGFGIAVSAPPPEVGIMLVQTKNAVITNNQIFSTGLGIFVRGSQSFGNRIEGNTLTAGANAALGICYNPADGDANGPKGDLITRNVIRGYPTSISIVATSDSNVVTGNTLFYRTAAFSNPNSSNLTDGNIEVKLK